MKAKLYYKGARPDGWDFYTGETINYRDSIGKLVRHPDPHPEMGLCSAGLLHASQTPNGIFIGCKIPLSLYRVRGIPVVEDEQKKDGFIEMEVLKELDPVKVFVWDYAEAVNPIHPFRIAPPLIDEKVLTLLKAWASVGASVRASVGTSVWAPVRAYIGSLFIAGVPAWKKSYPYQSAVDLWKMGLVPSYHGKVWRLHGEPNAKVLWEGQL